MSHPYPHRRTAALDHAALFDAARRRAEQLRREAIGDMWTAAARTLRRAWQRVAGGARPTHRAGPAARPKPCTG